VLRRGSSYPGAAGSASAQPGASLHPWSWIRPQRLHLGCSEPRSARSQLPAPVAQAAPGAAGCAQTITACLRAGSTRPRRRAGHRPSHLPPELRSPCLSPGRKNGRRADPQRGCPRLPGHWASSPGPAPDPHQNATAAEGPLPAQAPAWQLCPVRHPDPQHLAKVLWKSKFAFGEPGLTGREGDETASGRDFPPRATPRDFGPTAGPPAPPCPASSPSSISTRTPPSPAPPAHTDTAQQHPKLSFSSKM